MGPSKPVTYVTVCALGGDSAFCSLRRCREGKAVEAAPKAQIESASQMPEKPIHVPRAEARRLVIGGDYCEFIFGYTFC